jgi:hypothetical protein
VAGELPLADLFLRRRGVLESGKVYILASISFVGFLVWALVKADKNFLPGAFVSLIINIVASGFTKRD